MLHKVVVYISIYSFFQQAYGNFPHVQFFFLNPDQSSQNKFLAYTFKVTKIHCIWL